MPDAPEINALLASLGFDTPAGLALARTAIEEAGLTRAGKSRIDAAKVDRVTALLSERYYPSCGASECDRAAEGREVVRTATRNACAHCGGSTNERAMRGLERRLKQHGLSRVVVVGGSPRLHEELRALKSDTSEWRLVDGTSKVTSDDALVDLRWAHLVLVWGGTQLDHKVSTLYMRPPFERRVHVSRRGIAALLDEGSRHLDGG